MIFAAETKETQAKPKTLTITVTPVEKRSVCVCSVMGGPIGTTIPAGDSRMEACIAVRSIVSAQSGDQSGNFPV